MYGSAKAEDHSCTTNFHLCIIIIIYWTKFSEVFNLVSSTKTCLYRCMNDGLLIDDDLVQHCTDYCYLLSYYPSQRPRYQQPASHGSCNTVHGILRRQSLPWGAHQAPSRGNLEMVRIQLGWGKKILLIKFVTKCPSSCFEASFFVLQYELFTLIY